MTSRTWLRRRRPSIYEHVLAHIEPGEPGLREGGDELPDEAEASAAMGGLRWVPGALDGAFSRFSGEPDDTADRAAELHRAIVRLADRPGRGTRSALTALFREGADRWLLDALLERLAAEPPADEARLYREARAILLETSNREELKFALALVGAYGRREDRDVFRAIARHEEFTLYAAVALSTGADDPVGELLALLPDVSLWGATELSELLIAADDERARAVLLRQGASIGNALSLAVGCDLRDALEQDDVDDGLFRGAQSIVDALTWAPSGPEGLADYPDAGPAVERFLELLGERASTIADLLTADGVARHLEPPGETDNDRLEALFGIRLDPADPEERARELAGAGFDEARLARVRALASAIVDRPSWRPLVEAALEGGDESERGSAIAAAKALGLPLREYLVRTIESSPNDGLLWFHLAYAVDAAEIDDVVRLAERVLDLDALGSGAALEHFRPPGEGPHDAAESILQELPRFPGVGLKILLAALESPVVRHRLRALDAFSRWPRETIPPEVLAAVERRRTDPHDEVRAAAAAVAAGQPIPR